MKKIFYCILLGGLVSSCVSQKKFDEISRQLDDCNQKNELTNKNLSDAQQKIADLDRNTAALKMEVDSLNAENATKSKLLHQNKLDQESLRKVNSQLADQLKNSRSEAEVKALLSDLQKIQDKLQAREDALLASEKSLKEKELKVKELSDIISKQDSLMKNLRKKVADALTGFEGKGLEVINKNGKVYVSLDEKLLFKSGKWNVDAKGVEALNNIAKFLAENKDIHVVIEGHTDDQALVNSIGNIEDNWDLSVKRATAIVKTILKNKNIDPARITASGRAEFVPLDNAKTKEARQKNRRTEIILSPNMDELMKVLSNN
ncbi:MAG: OmpA family protein [Paludibacteraceae bacterium]|jgi:chemotaxis protein MotB|nr:OmpA family protein [Paludibacteraceae bacterium]MBO5864000.1 OmpA family protein [Paludibacteraceae bacterium]MBO5989672.1 OmpA family protein [Paludibacteraceae bacterium]MBQ1970036.1 OmpA family protein [Paludibacteraceae bacterium]